MQRPNVLRIIERHRQVTRRGVTLIELLMSTMVMAMIAVALASLARAVQMSSTYSHVHGTANQHARVAIERINRAVRHAAATADHPGVVVLSDQTGVWRFPDTLVVWKQDSNADELPQVNELVVFCPNPKVSGEFWELSTTSDTATVSLNDEAALKVAVNRLKAAGDSQVVVLTDLLRSASPNGDGSNLRAALRFEVELAPTATQWASYLADDSDWSALSWGQGIYGSQTGLRQVWVRYEIQFTSGEYAGDDLNHRELAIPFFGSATMYYELRK